MVNVPPLRKLLIVRTDRIGDVVLSLPMIGVVRSCFPSASISFLLRSYTKDLASGQPGLDDILLYDSEHGRKSFWTMLGEIRQRRFDAVVVTYPTFRLAFLMFLSRIPLRVGTGYRWYSLLFTRRVFEHRKTAEKHEAEYNMSLLRSLGCAVPSDTPTPLLQIRTSDHEAADAALEKIGLEGAARFCILHPGSGGSARDWKPGRFGELAKRLSSRGVNVLVTGGPGEERLVELVIVGSGGNARRLPGPLPLMALASLIRKADVFVSNSTGPLHIAAAVGTPVVAFFPPILQCSSARWGPLTDRKVLFEPQAVDCPRCRGGACQADDCMDLIKVEDVESAVLTLMEKRSERKSAVGAL